jgi:hypothetical protein
MKTLKQKVMDKLEFLSHLTLVHPWASRVTFLNPSFLSHEMGAIYNLSYLGGKIERIVIPGQSWQKV